MPASSLDPMRVPENQRTAKIAGNAAKSVAARDFSTVGAC
jgi:hypothetical protein